MVKNIQQFLVEEEELLTDFLLDMESTEGNKEYARTTALWSAQTARVGAIRDVLDMLGE